MFHEEYSFVDMQDYLLANIDLIICGKKTGETRSTFVADKLKKETVYLELNKQNPLKVNCNFLYQTTRTRRTITIDILKNLPSFLQSLNIRSKTILLDITSIEVELIFCLMQIFIKTVTPLELFLSYVTPMTYSKKELSKTSLELHGIPGFSRRITQKKEVLCPFIGFDGNRFNSLKEELGTNIEEIFPIISFPDQDYDFLNRTLWNTMDCFSGINLPSQIYKCNVISVYDAIEILEKIIQTYEHIIIAPIGSRPHCVASAIIAIKYPKSVRLIYDNLIDSDDRTNGVSKAYIYHLSDFLVAR